MLAHKRKQMIKELVDRYRIIRVSDLSERFNISDVTIRRDLKELEAMGVLRRTHGGAIKIANTGTELPLAEADDEQIKERYSIAKAAYRTIKDGDSIMLDSSSTAAMLATLIKNGDTHGLTLVTSSFRVVSELTGCPNADMIHIGGQVQHQTQSAAGPIAENTLRNLRVDKSFIGVNGVSLESGFTTPNILQCQVKRSMLSCAKQSYVLADASKFNQTHLSIICPLSTPDYVITDFTIEPEMVSAFQVHGINLMVAPEEDA